MNYSFAPHASALQPSSDLVDETREPPRMFALIDAGQLPADAKSIKARASMLPKARRARLFDDTFAKMAPHLSPVLIELDSAPEVCTEQILTLDRACRHLPVMAVLHSTESMEDLLAHLRSMLLIDAESVPYLLRFADTQMLAAANVAFTPAQRASFFSRTARWLSVDHEGKLCDAVSTAHHAQAAPPSAAPFAFDASQTSALLTAAAAPILASQLREREGAFRNRLGHAEQIRFASKCVIAAEQTGLDADGDLLTYAESRWRASVGLRKAAT